MGAFVQIILQRYRRLLISAIFVGSGIVASFAVTVLLVGNATETDRAGFFLFLAVYLPVLVTFGQSYTVLRYRRASAGRAGLALDLAVFASVAAALVLIGGRLIDPVTATLYAASVPFGYRANTRLAALQFETDSWTFAICPVLSGLVRILAALLAGWAGPAGAFLAGNILALVATLMWRSPAQTERPGGLRVAPVSHLGTLLFYAVMASVTFQWDRVYLSLMDRPELIASAGVCIVWMLSPISALYAVLSRAAAPGLFAGTPGGSRDFPWRLATAFVGASALYAAVAVTLWTPLNAVFFPFSEAPAGIAALLAIAVTLDRGAMLVILVNNRVRLYGLAAAAKTVLLAAAAVFLLSRSADTSLGLIFSTHVAIAAAYLMSTLIVARLVMRPARD